MDPSTILAITVASVAVFFFGAGAGGCYLWLSERIAWRDETIRALRTALEREHREATVAASSRRDMAAGDQAEAGALAGGAGPDDAHARLGRVLDLFGPREPAPPTAAAAADTGGSRVARPVG